MDRGMWVAAVFALVCLLVRHAGSENVQDNPLVQVLAEVQEALGRVDLTPTSVAKQIFLDNTTMTLRGSAATRRTGMAGFVADWVKWETCALALYDILHGVINFQIWAIKVLDSGTKLQSGLLQGNLLDLGQFDECVDTDRTDGHPSWVGQHCLIQLVLDMPGLGNQSINVNGASISIKDLLGGTSIKLTSSQCFPSVCKPKMIEEALGYAVAPIDFLMRGKNATLKVVIDERDCHLKDRGPLRTEEWVVIAVCGLFVVITILFTAFDILFISRRCEGESRKPTTAEQMLLAFSLPYNGKKMFGTSTNADQMGAINGMKFLSIAWVVLGHRYRYSVVQPLVNLLSVPDLLRQWTKMFILNATLSVDTFFLISGMLNAYGLCNLLDKKKRYNILDIIISYIYRYIRLSPAYWLMIAVTGTWLYRVGNGPIWDRLVGDARDNCQMTWWSNIVYLNNYLNPDQNCMMQSWYLAADMQMFWISPFVIYPLWRWPIFGLVELFICAVASVAAPFAVAYLEDIREPIPISQDSVKVSREMDMLYLPTHTKTICYVIGIFVGYVVQKLKTKKIRLPFNLIIRLAGWIVAGVFMLYALFGCYWLFQMDNPLTLLESSFYLAFYRLLWGIGVGWVILVCVTGHGGFVNDILSWKPFGPLGRLTYCIYLTHIAVIIYRMGSIKTAMYLEDYGQIEQFLGDLIMSIWGAIILSLVLEAPFLTYLNFLIPKKRPPRPKPNPEPEGAVQPGGSNQQSSTQESTTARRQPT